MKCSSRIRVAVAVALVPLFLVIGSVQAYTPHSPEVKQMILPGVKFLENTKGDHRRIGGSALIGLVMYKYHRYLGIEEKHPVLKEAIRKIRKKLGPLDHTHVEKDNIYDVGLMTILLTEVDHVEYASEINCLLKNLQFRQKKCGGWGYANRDTGDTSMTQYGVLSYWTALQKDFDIPVESIEGVSDWLLRTQDPSGAFGYQGQVSKNYVPIPQSNVRHSMAAAGLGSVYICANMFGFKSGTTSVKGKKDLLAPALRRVVKKDKDEKKPEIKTKAVETKFTEAMFRPVMHRGRNWFAHNQRLDADLKWVYYYMYARERYETFREVAERKGGSALSKGPRWYNDGVVFLASQQKENGSWKGTSDDIPSTCFALLFLLRASGQSVQPEPFGEGMMAGGKGLPKNTDNVEVGKDGGVVQRPLRGPAEELLRYLEDEDRDIDATNRLLGSLDDLPPTQVQAIADKHKELLYQLAEHQSGEARIAAVRTMGKTRDYDYVPVLIYVLRTDPDPKVACEARNILRAFARKPGGFGMPNEPDMADRKAASSEWKKWYLAVQPDAKFRE